ncbi:probable short-chain dehydrogenase (plasmid) [Rhodococcus jostii RHA1]|uniref:Probable short-chain dehydrogenase n=1 Tax=Rhodococcus jostii (strain RHA1) TaxID=101510 RepID=Q0RXI5_RHOJR|nr:SDR family oxidoreductase [Rhodococcus jostii]ABH00001.1 probable short-chain dehydrogenase [Rhodococcus jostii RHA1]
MDRFDITFTSDSQACAGWFYRAAVEGPAPCIVMAHGLAGVKEMRLDAYAERFAGQGYHVLVFDYRHFGASAGTPRQVLDIGKQHTDWIAAVDYARSRPEVDSSRIVLWGSSLSGGHAMALAKPVGAAAAIAQVPHTDGIASLLAIPPVQSLRLTGHALYDVVRSALGLSPHYVAASGEPGSPALMTAPEAAGYLQLVPQGHQFDQRVAARFALRVGLYSPGRALRDLDIPVLVQVATKDETTPPTPAVKAGKRARRGVVRTYDCGHFAPYLGETFETIVTDQIQFLQQALDSNQETLMPRTVVITGAGAGIGRAAARRFAAKGWTLCATDVDSSALDELRADLGDQHTYASLDVTDKAEIARVFAEFAAAHGGSFEVLVNNAGVAFIDKFEDMTLEQHELITRVNVNGVLNCTYLAFPHLSKTGDAKVINMCSLSAEYGVPSEATYSASKFWVRGFTEAMNIEWERHGIHVCDIMPNFVATPMMDAAHGDIVDSIGINLTADDVATTILEAAEDRARVHWIVDTTKLKIVRAITNNVPAPIRRRLIKKFAGF